MEKYRFDMNTRIALERSVVPMGVYQLVDGRVVTLIASDGLRALFAGAGEAQADAKADRGMCWNVHPDDAKRVEAAVAGFMREEKPYNLVYRANTAGGWRIIHTRGERVTAQTGERLAVVWYIDEGPVALDAGIAKGGEWTEDLESAMHALLNNMPALSFSKDVQTGAYTACNQAFADFAHRRTPADVVGLTDFDLFDSATAARFVADDRKALSMDAPYEYFEDVADGAGGSRRFQTAKLKFIDDAGRFCLLGMSMDVTRATRARRESAPEPAAGLASMSSGTVYESIVKAISEDFFNLYYVDLETNEYVEYGSRTEEGEKASERSGADFFAEALTNAASYIYEEDVERFKAAMDREKLLSEIKKHGAYIFHYRLMIAGVPAYVSLKATRIAGDDRHIVIGVSNVDTQVNDRMAAERAAEEEKLYLRLSALNGNLIVLYIVDPENDRYTEFNSSKGFETLGIAKQGSDFFRTPHENSLRMVHPEDQAMFQAQVTKANILATIERDGVFVIDYRLMIGDLPTYVRLKAAVVEEGRKPMLIIGLLNEDAQARQEREYAHKLSDARRMAVVDPLTGVKNKHAYMQWEEKINAKIESGEQKPFAVAVCDVNNLKAVNDQHGHKEGDACIKKACARICKIFSHSPVFRIGGDEFVVILSGEDYERRADLMRQVNYIPKDPSQARIGETVAAGIVEYRRGQHASLLSVFEEADKAMYERKQQLKRSASAEGEPSRSVADEDISVINVRKRILIADDLEMNREILESLLGEDYDILCAADGVETLEVLRRHRNEIDLVLLDLYMPKMSGREVFAQMQLDEELMSIPVIFLTVDEKAELDCLKIGAMDFIPKPYPDIEIVKARIAKCIELSEDRDLIRHTERDKLTGLLNKEFFFRYVHRLDQIYKPEPLDAVACDINRFHSINKQYGRQFGDRVLRSVGVGLKKLARRVGGIVCRESGDTFLLYGPHQDDYEPLLRQLLSDVLAEADMAERVGLRFGIFVDAQRTMEVENRFARAKSAADQVKEDPQALYKFHDFADSPS